MWLGRLAAHKRCNALYVHNCTSIKKMFRHRWDLSLIILDNNTFLRIMNWKKMVKILYQEYQEEFISKAKTVFGKEIKKIQIHFIKFIFNHSNQKMKNWENLKRKVSENINLKIILKNLKNIARIYQRDSNEGRRIPINHLDGILQQRVKMKQDIGRMIGLGINNN